MAYVVLLADGQPRDLFESLETKVLTGTASKRERQLAGKIARTIGYLARIIHKRDYEGKRYNNSTRKHVHKCVYGPGEH